MSVPSARDERTTLPTGRVAFLFSDIEGSTRRWESVPEAMRDAVRRHDQLLRTAVESNQGYVFKTVGDEFCTAFQDVGDAIAAALDAQYAIAAADWTAIDGLRVRMAIHIGETDERDGDYFGRPVNRVARLLSTAYGGEMVLSEAAAESAHDSLPAGSSLRDLGRHRLKDLAEPERIFQLLAPDLTADFPPLRSLERFQSNLPQNVTAFFGREEDLAELDGMLREHRITTLCGTGGIGKTRLALQAAADHLERYEGGVWLVELAPLQDPALLPITVANVLGVQPGNSPVVEALIGHIRSTRTLLILDNCEHLIEAASALAEALVRGAAGAAILATSRQALGIPGEHVHRLPSLGVPPANVALTAEAALRYDAVALFVDRAQAYARNYHLTDADAPIVAEICRHLDGVALAIELAVPRLRALSVRQLNERLSERFRLLTGGSRAALPRQQTLRALIDWSYDLLAENERTVFRRCGVFLGDWTLEGAMAVCSDDAIDAFDVMDLLTVLIDKSLVLFDASGEEPQYRMLESTRQYALERLMDEGERDRITRRHAEWVRDVSTAADATWSRMAVGEWLAPLKRELDNIRAVLEWAIGTVQDIDLGVELIGALDVFWWDAQQVEGRHWINAATPYLDRVADRRVQAKFWLCAANVALALRDQKAALETAQRALEAFEAIGDVTGIAMARRCCGSALNNLGRRSEGEPMLLEALATFRAVDNRRMIGLILRNLGVARFLAGEFEASREAYQEALVIAQELGDERGGGIVSINLAELEFASGNVQAAITYGYEALEYVRMRNNWVNLCNVLVNLSAYLLALERYDEASITARQAVEMAQEIDSELFFAIAVQHLALIAVHAGRVRRAAILGGFVDAFYEGTGSVREPTEAAEYEKLMLAIGENLEEDEARSAHAQGHAMTRAAAMREALAV